MNINISDIDDIVICVKCKCLFEKEYKPYNGFYTEEYDTCRKCRGEVSK